ncbi:MAG: hypothetical protein IKR57_01645 [Bacilli bacterium]|nr:hypothetical protein [Bacilli bacterium]
MFNNLYSNLYNSQPSIDRINAQIQELENMKKQIQQPVQQPTNLTQNFQIAPTNREVIKYANNMEEVQRDLVIGDTPYFSKDMSVVWIKNTKGDIKTYELNEIVAKDEKDFEIEYLKEQIEELKKGMVVNEQYDSNDDAKYDETSTTKDVEPIRTTIKKSKSSSLSRFSNSKKE